MRTLRRILAALAFVVAFSAAAFADVAYYLATSLINSTGSTASTANFVFVGSGSVCQLIPQTSGKFTLSWLGQGSNSTATDAFKYKMAYGTGTPPAANAAASGVGTLIPAGAIANTGTSATAGALIPVQVVLHLSLPAGWVPGTVYWFDEEVVAVTGGTATLSSLQCSANEE